MYKILLTLIFLVSACDGQEHPNKGNSSKGEVADTSSRVNYPEQLLPITGYTNNPNLEGIAPLEIRTSTGTNYWIKIDEASTNKNIASYFIRSGESLNVMMPLGTYTIKYATGEKWYGTEYLFGDDTVYSKADSLFNFVSDGNRTSGYSIELIRQVNGNLQTQNINKNQF